MGSSENKTKRLIGLWYYAMFEVTITNRFLRNVRVRLRGNDRDHVIDVRGYNVILRSCFHQNQRFALTTIVNAHFWAAFMLILRRRFETLIQNADPKRRSRKYCSCFPREEDDTFTEEGMSRNSRNV